MHCTLGMGRVRGTGFMLERRRGADRWREGSERGAGGERVVQREGWRESNCHQTA